jgi:hypothetical protein
MPRPAPRVAPATSAIFPRRSGADVSGVNPMEVPVSLGTARPALSVIAADR